ncbi:MAG: hypothetical protein ACNA7W_12685 [Pseudomonadales bacterium]
MQSLFRLSSAACLSAMLALAIAAPSAVANSGNGNAFGKNKESTDSGDETGGDTGGDSGGDTGSSVFLAFAGDATEVAAGEAVRLSWSSANARHCFASGDWSGKMATEGVYTTAPLAGPASFVLECKTGGNSATEMVTVQVTGATDSDLVVVEEPAETPPAEEESSDSIVADGDTGEGTIDDGTTGDSIADGDTTGDDSTVEQVADTTEPAPTPSLALQAYDAEVRTGESATLSWSGESVSNCTASGAWSGARAASGSEIIGPLEADASFTLTCESAAGNLMAMTSVLVTDGGTTLSWVPPEENVDGTPLTDLKGYRIYVGTSSRNYASQIELADPSITDYFLALSRGEYYVAMTAIDAEGNESGYSNEVLKAVN